LARAARRDRLVRHGGHCPASQDTQSRCHGPWTRSISSSTAQGSSVVAYEK
jgi:hypothetical protein